MNRGPKRALFRRTRTAYAGGYPHFLLVHGGSKLRPRAEEPTDAVGSVLTGGLKIQVPEDRRVALEVASALGGRVDDRPTPVGSRGLVDLRATGRVMLGRVEVGGG